MSFLGFILDVRSRFAEERLRKQVQDVQEKLDSIQIANSKIIDNAFQMKGIAKSKFKA